MHPNAAARAVFTLFFTTLLTAGTLHAQSGPTGGPTHGSLTSFVVIGDNLFAGSPDGGGVFRSAGPYWAPVNSGLTNRNVRDLAASGTTLFAATAGGVFRSEDDGASWTEVNEGLMNTDVLAIAQHGRILLAVTTGGVYFSISNGNRWWSASLSFPGAGSTDDAPGEGAGLQAAADGINRMQTTELPAEFDLKQNYPNPFNPVTRIGFDVPVEGFVSLSVFDLLGRELAPLLRDVLGPGSYEVTFDGSRLPSGAYLYRMRADGFVKTRQLILLK